MTLILEAVPSSDYTEEELAKLPTRDYSMLTEYERCPKKGLLRYHLRKTPISTRREMALEAGTLAHEGFSSMRLLHLKRDGFEAHFHHHGRRLFGKRRHNDAFDEFTQTFTNSDELRAAEINYITSILYSSDFFDDPDDRYRTQSNIEESVLRRYDTYDWNVHVWVEDKLDPTKRVGIELPVDCVFTIYEIGYIDGKEVKYLRHRIRFVGRIDGLHVLKNRTFHVQDEKTTKYLNDIWEVGNFMSWQVRMCYLLAANTMYGLTEHGRYYGVQIPPPRDYFAAASRYVDVSLKPYEVTKFVNWLDYILTSWERFAADPINAPEFRHNCRSFQRRCVYIPVCDSTDEDALEMIKEMGDVTWNPLDEWDDD